MLLQVVTPEGTVLNGVEITALVVPSTEGYLGVLDKHAPMVAALKPGVVRYREAERLVFMAVGSGFVEVSANQATLLVDMAERAEEIDMTSARANFQRLFDQVRKKPAAARTSAEVEALDLATARLQAAESLSGSARRH